MKMFDYVYICIGFNQKFHKNYLSAKQGGEPTSRPRANNG